MSLLPSALFTEICHLIQFTLAWRTPCEPGQPRGPFAKEVVPRGCNSHRTMTDLVVTPVAWTPQCHHLRFLMEMEESFSAHHTLHNRAEAVAS